jgi:hypothetical protein
MPVLPPEPEPITDPQHQSEEAVLMSRVWGFGVRGVAGTATLTAEELLPVPRHALCGLTATQACRLLQAQALAVGLEDWWRGHLDHVWAVALLCYQTQLPLVCSLLYLVLTAQQNMQLGSGGRSRVQGQAGTRLQGQLRSPPRGKRIDLAASREVWGGFVAALHSVPVSCSATCLTQSTHPKSPPARTHRSSWRRVAAQAEEHAANGRGHVDGAPAAAAPATWRPRPASRLRRRSRRQQCTLLWSICSCSRWGGACGTALPDT